MFMSFAFTLTRNSGGWLAREVVGSRVIELVGIRPFTECTECAF